MLVDFLLPASILELRNNWKISLNKATGIHQLEELEQG